jgi:hypothetical protein
MQTPEKYIGLTPSDIQKIKKEAFPKKAALLGISLIFLIFVAIIVFNLPYFWAIICSSVFPAITLGAFCYVYLLTLINVKSGKLRLIHVKIEDKTIELGSMNTKWQMHPRIDIPTYYYVFVNRKKIEIEESDYNRFEIGNHVELKMTRFGKIVIAINSMDAKNQALGNVINNLLTLQGA